MRRLCLLWFVVLCYAGCGDDLKPPDNTQQPPTGRFSGVIRYSHWDSAGTVNDLRLVAFRNFPLTDLLNEVQAGRAFVYPAFGDPSHLPFLVDSTTYNVTVPVGIWKYVAIAQQFGPSVTTDWRAVGQYDLDTNLYDPSSIVVAQDSTTSNIDINVDFDHLPPPPFR